MESDVLIVGSGLAGLSFGALMARSGARVTVLEAHDAPGGYGHTFSFGEPGRQYQFNAQLHYVWNCGPGRTVNRFLRRLGLAEEVTFERYDLDGHDRMRMPGYALDIPADYGELVARLAALCPAHAGAIAAFVDEVRALADELDTLPTPLSVWTMLPRLPRLRRVLRYRHATLQDAFDRFELPQPAQTLLALQWPDFLLPPARLSFFAWVMLFTGYQRGAWYPTRHFEHVIDSLVGVIEEHGGAVKLCRDVVAFELDGQRVRGVRAEVVEASGAGTGVFEEHLAERVVCNMDPRRAAEMIGLERFSADVRKRLDYSYSPSNFMAYCVVEGLDLRDHGFGRSNLFHTEEPDLNAAFEAMYERGDYGRPSFAVTAPSLLTDHGGDAPEGAQVLELLTVADYRRFLSLKLSDPRAYRAKKQEVFDRMLDVVEAHYVPGLRDHLVFKMTGSPTTNERYCRAPAGNSYGSDLTPAQVGAGRLNHHSSLERFHFCNASSGFPGFAGTIWTGCTLYEHLTGDQLLTGPLPTPLPRPTARPTPPPRAAPT